MVALNPKAKGEITEAIIMARLMQNGEIVLRPFGDNQRFDLVLYRNGAFVRVQCKTARFINGTVRFSAESSYRHRGRGVKNYIGDVDIFAAYCPVTDKVYLVPASLELRTGAYLRVDPPKKSSGNRLIRPIRWAQEYELKCGVA